jgi:hypothetical protein
LAANHYQIPLRYLKWVLSDLQQKSWRRRVEVEITVVLQIDSVYAALPLPPFRQSVGSSRFRNSSSTSRRGNVSDAI